MKEHGWDCDKLGKWGHKLGKQGGGSPGVPALKQFQGIAQMRMPPLFLLLTLRSGGQMEHAVELGFESLI